MPKPTIIRWDFPGANPLYGAYSIGNILPHYDLNYQSKNISSFSISNGIGSITTTSDHNIPTSIPQYKPDIRINHHTDANNIYNGIYELLSVIDSVSFTIKMTGKPDGSFSNPVPFSCSQVRQGFTYVTSVSDGVVYRITDTLPNTNQFFIKITEGNPPVTEGNNWVRVVGMETPDGLNPFPSTGYVLIRKSTTNDNTNARPYMIISDNYGAYFIIWSDVTSVIHNTPASVYYIGQIDKYYVNDAWCNMISGGFSTTYHSPLLATFVYGNAMTATDRNGWFNRRADGTVGAVPAILIGGMGANLLCNTATKNSLGSVGFNYSIENPLLFTRPILCENTKASIRGFLPGLYYPLHNRPLSNFTILSVGNKRLMAIHTLNTADNNVTGITNTSGQIFIDISENFRIV